jgi:hypothetical protein
LNGFAYYNFLESQYLLLSTAICYTRDVLVYFILILMISENQHHQHTAFNWGCYGRLQHSGWYCCFLSVVIYHNTLN